MLIYFGLLSSVLGLLEARINIITLLNLVRDLSIGALDIFQRYNLMSILLVLQVAILVHLRTMESRCLLIAPGETVIFNLIIDHYFKQGLIVSSIEPLFKPKQPSKYPILCYDPTTIRSIKDPQGNIEGQVSQPYRWSWSSPDWLEPGIYRILLRACDTLSTRSEVIKELVYYLEIAPLHSTRRISKPLQITLGEN